MADAAWPIVVGVDGSQSALYAVGWAADEAMRRKLPLCLVHANAAPFAGSPSSLPQHADNTLLNRARGWLDQAADTARKVAPDSELDVSLQAGQTVGAVLVAQSRTARLMVLGSRGLGRSAESMVGSVAVTLAAYGDAPVVAVHGRVPDGPPPETGSVVVGVDGSPASEAAIAFAFDQASWRGVAVVAVHTWSEVMLESTFEWAGVTLDWDAIETDERQLLAQRLAGWQERYPDVPVQRVVTRERPVRSLLHQGAHAQLVVVGRRGRGGFTEMLLGSTSQALLHHAPCPVAVIRPAPTS